MLLYIFCVLRVYGFREYLEMPAQPQKALSKDSQYYKDDRHHVFSFDDRDIDKFDTMPDEELKGIVEDLWSIKEIMYLTMKIEVAFS